MIMTARTLAAYGLPGLPLAFAALPLYVHVPRFYAETVGLDLALLGGVLFATRLLDAGIDPWLGALADRVCQRRMFAIALLPFGLGFAALLNPPAEHALLWLLGALFLTYTGFSAASVAYQAWGAALGEDAAARTRLTAAREGFGLGGVVLAAALPGLLAADLNQGVARLPWVLLPLLGIAVLVSLTQVGSGQPPGAGGAVSGDGARHLLVRVLADPPFRRLLAVFVANGIAAALPATLFLFFVADVLAAESASGPLLALYFVAGAASLPGWVRLAAHIGRPGAWMLAMGLALLAFAGAGLLGAGDVLPFALVCLLSGFALGADLALPAALAADLGARRGQAGACFGVWNFVAKLNLALAAGLALPLLGLFGYTPGQSGTAGQGALVLAYAVLPVFFKLLALGLLWRWRHQLEERS